LAWNKQTGMALGRTARFLKLLRTLKPGEHVNLPKQEFQDMEFPVHPLARLTWEEKANWLCARADFPCKCWERITDGTFVFERTI